MNINWIILLLLLLFGFVLGQRSDSGGVEVVSTAAMVEVNGNPGVILEASAYRPDAEGWSPDLASLQAAEDAVAAESTGDRAPQLDGYRQYVGIVEEGDRKVIVNSMCQEIDGWDSSYIEVADGGPCFWNAVYNVDTGELELLIVNGEA